MNRRGGVSLDISITKRTVHQEAHSRQTMHYG